MTPQIGEIERQTQNRIVEKFQQILGYDYLGNWEEKENNSNVEEELLRAYLSKTGKYSERLIDKAIADLKKITENQGQDLYSINKKVYHRLRYGASIKEEVGKNSQKVHYIDWEDFENNDFAIAEEVTVRGNRTKRPDIVLYVNGIALGVIELKRSTISVSEGIRQNIGNQKEEYIKNFFATMQLVMAGNDTEGLMYGTTETPEEYYVSWDPNDSNFSEEENKLDRNIMQVCQKSRFLEIVHDFIVFDHGIKITCRHNQYFGVKAAQESVKEHKGGIIWHTQGSGKTISMVWLARWIKENMENSRVLLLTDRIELDEQIVGVFKGADETIHKAKSASDLMDRLNRNEDLLISSLVHKFARVDTGVNENVEQYLAELRNNLTNFEAKGDIFVFVDECHRSHSGRMHEAMKQILPKATFIGFTGTPLLKIDKNNSIGIWGGYIHEYKYNEAVNDKVVLDLRYEARRIPQQITDQDKIDDFFERKTKGLTDHAKVQLKQRWGTMQALLSSKNRMERISFDILDYFEEKPRLASGRGNAMLVANSIHEACQYYQILQSQGFDKCAVITSYQPNALSTDTPEYDIYKRMLEKYRSIIDLKPGESETDAFERIIKKKFVKEPGQMQLLIVVDKLLTGFDAPPASYLFIDKKMQDHGLFQAICRVNRLHGDDKDYGYIVDYRDLFKKLEQAVTNYTSEAFSGFDQADVVGILKDRFEESKKDLNDALEAARTICEPVAPPQNQADYIRYFCGDTENPYALKENEIKRVELYKSVSKLLRAYSEIANDMGKVGYTDDQASIISKEVKHFEQLRTEIKLASGDYIDLKKYEPAMRSLMDRYISAEESEKLSSFDDQSLVELLAEKGDKALDDLPSVMRGNEEAIAETIENNVRRLITDETPANPKYYQRMSELLDELVKKRKEQDIKYQEYLDEIISLSKKVKNPSGGQEYPTGIDTKAKQALFDNFGQDEERALKLYKTIKDNCQDDFRGDFLKERLIKNSIKQEFKDISEDSLDNLLEIIRNQNEY
jgi:type I restriction enzyme, R subunit